MTYSDHPVSVSGPAEPNTTSEPATTPGPGTSPVPADISQPTVSSDPAAATPFSEPENATPFSADVDPSSAPVPGAADSASSALDTPESASEVEPVAGASEPEAAEPVMLPPAPHQTFAGRVWVGLIAAAVLLVLLIIFIAENTRSISVNFLGLHGHISEGLALLIAIVVGIIITLLVGSARIVQLSLELRRHRRKLKDLT